MSGSAGSLVRVVSGRYAGMTVSAIARACRRPRLHVLRELERGVEPVEAPPKPAKPNGRPPSPARVAWGEKHLPPELRTASWAELLRHFHVSPGTLAGWIHGGASPALGKPRASNRERFKAWRAQHLPEALRYAPGEAIAAHYDVHLKTVYGWARDGLAPVAGGRQGLTRRSDKALRWRTRYVPPALRQAKTRTIAAHYRVSVPAVYAWIRDGMEPVAGGRRHAAPPRRRTDPRLAPLVAELYARQPVASRLTRIFMAEMHVGGG